MVKNISKIRSERAPQGPNESGPTRPLYNCRQESITRTVCCEAANRTANAKYKHAKQNKKVADNFNVEEFFVDLKKTEPSKIIFPGQ